MNDLNQTQTRLYKAIMNDSHDNCERQWHYNKRQDLKAVKTTDPKNGESKVEFFIVPRVLGVDRRKLRPGEPMRLRNSLVDMLKQEIEKKKKEIEDRKVLVENAEGELKALLGALIIVQKRS